MPLTSLFGKSVSYQISNRERERERGGIQSCHRDEDQGMPGGNRWGTSESWEECGAERRTNRVARAG
jgi:hypothetical protein